jgi:hypothetical protein
VQNTFTMDLHGMNVEEAVSELSQQVEALSRLRAMPQGVMLRVRVTKGGRYVDKRLLQLTLNAAHTDMYTQARARAGDHGARQSQRAGCASHQVGGAGLAQGAKAAAPFC